MSEENKAVPVCWFEAEESARGGDPRELMWGMCHSTRCSKDKPATGNPVWPLYAIPEGYVLVPVEPTPGMWDAAWSAFGATEFEDLHPILSVSHIKRLYSAFHSAMLAARSKA